MSCFRVTDINSCRLLELYQYTSKGLFIQQQDNASHRIFVVLCNKNNHWSLKRLATTDDKSVWKAWTEFFTYERAFRCKQKN